MHRSVLSAISFLLAGLVCASLMLAQMEPSLYGQNGGKRRVYVTDSNSWSISGGFGGSSGGFGGGVRGGARPQTAEVIKTFGKKCHGVIVTINRQAADFVVLFDHEGGKGMAQKDNKIAVFNRAGDAIFSNSTRSLGSAVDDACKAIMRSPVVAAPAPPPPAPPASVVPAPTAPAQPAMKAAPPAPAAPAPPETPAAEATDDSQSCLVFIKSSPNGADITVDGKFVGNTPSNLKLPAGDHKIQVEMQGYKSWERTMTVMEGGSVTLSATLAKNE
jgi:PEGA domain